VSERRQQSAGGGGSLPAAPQRIPGLPENASFFELNEFRTLNRQVSRASIGDEDMAWCHNLAPIAPNYLRATPDNSPLITTSAQEIIGFDFLITGPFEAVAIQFKADGSAAQVEIEAPHTVTIVAPAGTFSVSPLSVDSPAMIQAGISGTTVAVIVSPQIGATDTANGFFIWDGTNLFRAGTVSPVTVITDGGHNYTSAPSVSVFGGSGTGAAFTAEVVDGSVSQVKATAPGIGYLSTDSAILVFSGGGQGTSAYGLGVTANGVITSLTLISGGSGFTGIPSIVITPVAGGSGASAVVTSISGGVITGVQMIAGGSGYNAGATISTSGGGGSGVMLVPVIENGVVVGVNMISNGSGYSSPPRIAYISTSGSGATGRVILTNGQIQGVAFDFPSQGGSGYQTPPIVQFIGGGGPASGTVTLMPFGIKGTCIETYVSRIWIGDGNRIFFTAPESLVDFGNGGGVFQDTDSFQRFAYVDLKQSNGFLYLISDSSVNYISGVTTSGTPPITTFTNLNIDPQIGSDSRDSVTVYSRQILFGNGKGVYAITGGAVQKISTQLDLEFYSPFPTPATMGNYGKSSAVFQVFAEDTYTMLVAVFNPFTRANENLFLVWNGKRWFTASQTAPILLVNTFEQNSQLIAYGTDGFSLFPLFQNAGSTNLMRALQSKLWVKPTIVTEKKAWAIFALFECYNTTTLDFDIDTETGEFNVTQGEFVGSGTQLAPGIQWARSSALAPAGHTIGFTMTSQSADFALLSAVLVAIDYSLST
jgi:hypothetical protein